MQQMARISSRPSLSPQLLFSAWYSPLTAGAQLCFAPSRLALGFALACSPQRATRHDPQV